MDLYLFRGDRDYLKCKTYDKRDDFSFEIINYPYLESNIPRSPAYGVYVSRLVAFARTCSDISDFTYRHDLLAKKLITQGYTIKYLRKVFVKFTQKHTELITKYDLQVSHFLKNHLSLSIG